MPVKRTKMGPAWRDFAVGRAASGLTFQLDVWLGFAEVFEGKGAWERQRSWWLFWCCSQQPGPVLAGKPRYSVDGKTFELAPGSYLVVLAKAHHQLSCGADSECVVLYRWTGPLDFHFDK